MSYNKDKNEGMMVAAANAAISVYKDVVLDNPHKYGNSPAGAHRNFMLAILSLADSLNNFSGRKNPDLPAGLIEKVPLAFITSVKRGILNSDAKHLYRTLEQERTRTLGTRYF